jgi:hypothetical protein
LRFREYFILSQRSKSSSNEIHFDKWKNEHLKRDQENKDRLIDS